MFVCQRVLTNENIMEDIEMHKLFVGVAALLACWLPSGDLPHAKKAWQEKHLHA